MSTSHPGWFGRHKILTTVLAGFLFFMFIGNAFGEEDEPATTSASSAEDATSDDSGSESGEPEESSPSGEVDSITDDEASGSDGDADPGVTAKTKKKPQRTYLVTRIVDGDTLELGNGETVRVVGIDTPEQGECGYEKASDNLAALVLGKNVRLTISDEDIDRYGRWLRYVNLGAMDAGLRQIKQGFAIARYDSRDGYGFHPREPIYIKADKGSKQLSCPKPVTAPPPPPTDNCMTGYSPCLPMVADLDCGDINGPVTVTGSDPYRLDADGDGIGCDS